MGRRETDAELLNDSELVHDGYLAHQGFELFFLRVIVDWNGLAWFGFRRRFLLLNEWELLDDLGEVVIHLSCSLLGAALQHSLHHAGFVPNGVQADLNDTALTVGANAANQEHIFHVESVAVGDVASLVEAVDFDCGLCVLQHSERLESGRLFDELAIYFEVGIQGSHFQHLLPVVALVFHFLWLLPWSDEVDFGAFACVELVKRVDRVVAVEVVEEFLT